MQMTESRKRTGDGTFLREFDAMHWNRESIGKHFVESLHKEVIVLIVLNEVCEWVHTQGIYRPWRREKLEKRYKSK